ncbi:GPI-anchored adhesin protein [Populus alba x Populus x berolinensis]|uniref:GPI-anchored adhesin protein n=1 Tax=Populus alba x Populus x berolinensis TaxID=444605 RepID=A0AAD6QEV5_9ROSI|nr:GPI-anchored adhesin protein [Populus alba x Populus x berolinensis]
MAVAAFKSTSRRASTTSTATQDKETSTNQHALPTKTVPPRRSRSVSAVSRSYLVDTSTTRTAAEGTATGSTNLLIKRDNPLYWSNVSPPDKEVGEVVVDKEESKSAPTKPNVVGDGRRGRSVSRKADAGKNVSGIGRSLSRGPVSRGRSVSRPPGSRGHFVNSESDAEREGSSLTKYRNGSGGLSGVSNAGRNSDLARSYDCKFEKMRSFPMQSDGSASDLPSLPMRSWEDKGLGSSISEAEERTIKAVFEQMQSFKGIIWEMAPLVVYMKLFDLKLDAPLLTSKMTWKTIRRSNTTAIALANVNDIPPDLVNPSAVELVLDIRREYAKKLEQYPGTGEEASSRPCL